MLSRFCWWSHNGSVSKPERTVHRHQHPLLHGTGHLRATTAPLPPAGLVDCGPILPAFPGQRPAEGTLMITNPTDRPVEVVCLDLDHRHQDDEEALKMLDM